MARLAHVVALLGLLAGGTPARAASVAGEAARLRQAVWQGIVITYDPNIYAFSVTNSNPNALGDATLAEHPDPTCDPQTDCVEQWAYFQLFRSDGLSVREWTTRRETYEMGSIQTRFTDVTIGGRQATKSLTLLDLFVQQVYVVPVGDKMLLISGIFDETIVRQLQFSEPSRQQLVVGAEASTRPGRALDLWTRAAGGQRVYERPSLRGGTFLTIQEIRPKAVRIRTSEGVEGWLRAAAADVLTTTAPPPGEHLNLALPYAEVIHRNGIPLRAGPSSSAPKLVEQLKAGTQLVIYGVRGDWLLVRAGDSDFGWVRWFYDGARYIDVVGP